MIRFLTTSPKRRLADAVARLERSATPDEVVEVLRATARALGDADGVTVVRRIGDEVAYVGEDAIAPLWTGQSFPIRLCVTGMAITRGETIVIPDIMIDRRVPLNAYLGTFVRSLAAVPVGTPVTMAIGAYWREVRIVPAETLQRLEALAASAGAALTRIGSVARAA